MEGSPTPGERAETLAELNDVVAPLADGIRALNTDVLKTHKSLNEKMEQVAKDSTRKVEDLEEKVNRSMEDLILRHEKLASRSSLINQALGVITSDDDGLLDIIPKEVKAQAGFYEHFGQSMPKDSPLKVGRVGMAVAEWFRAATRLCLPRQFNSSSHADVEMRDKLFAALQEKHFGPQWEAITKAAYAEGEPAIANTSGGTLVPTIVEADIIRLIKDAGDIFPLARQVAMRSQQHNMPSEQTAVTVGWIDEAGTLTGGEGTFSQKVLKAEKIYGRATISLEMVQDSAPSILSYLLEVFTEKMAGELDYQMVLGDGSGPAITGILNGSGINIIATFTTAAGRNLTYPLMVSVFTGGSEKSTRLTGRWYCSPKGYAAILSLADSTGMPIVQFNNVPNAPSGTFLGRPIVVSARLGGTGVTLDDLTANLNTTILFGPPEALLFGTRMGMTWDVTDQVNWNKAQYDARLLGRFAGNVAIPAAFSKLSKVNI